MGQFKFHVLKRVGSKSFMDELKEDSKRRRDYDLIEKQLTRIAQAGVDWALKGDVLKKLKGTHGRIPLYELRCLRETVRIMVYLHKSKEGKLTVLLFDFKGHTASKSVGGIRKKEIERGEKLAKTAKGLMT